MAFDPISQRPASYESAMGAAGQMSVTGTDRVLNRERIFSESEVARAKTPFIQKFLELFNIDPENIPNVEKKAERKPHEEQLFYYERLKKLTDYKIKSVTSRREKDKKRPKPRSKAAQSEQAAAQENTAGANFPVLAKLKNADQNIVKDYIILSAQKLMQIPPEEQEMVKATLSYLENKLREFGLTEEDFYYLSGKIKELLISELSLLIKDKFVSALSKPVELADWVLKNRHGKEFLNFALHNLNMDKFTRTILEAEISGGLKAEIGENVDLKKYGLMDLIDLAQEFKINLASWIKMWSRETIEISTEQDLEIEVGEKKKEVSLLFDELRISITNKLLENNLRNRIKLAFKIRSLTGALKARGAEWSDISEINSQAKRIAWVKTIADLKEAHLNRIFTVSSAEFDNISRRIEDLTRKSRWLGKDIHEEGIKWIESEIETLAIDTATYKMNLVKSLQSMGYEESREKDIKHLERTISKLKRRRTRIHEVQIFSHFISSLWNRFFLLIEPKI